MSFAAPPDAYDRYVGRYSRELAPRFLDFADVPDGPVLDVGCGPGLLTEALAARLGGARVSAIDPSRSFAETCCARVPLADVRVGTGEALPFAAGAFDAALSQLVLPLAKDGKRFLAESSRVVRRGGVVAACTFAAFAPAAAFWNAARRFDAAVPDDARLPFQRMPELEALWAEGGLSDVSTAELDVQADYADFDDLWSPLESGVGPTGSYLVAQPDERRAAVRDACWQILGSPPAGFTLSAHVIAIRGRV